MIACIVLAWSPHAEAQVANFEYNLPSKPGCWYGSIQAAINAAPANGTVRVAPGTRFENLEIPKNITIKVATPGSACQTESTTDRVVLKPASGGAAVISVLANANLTLHDFDLRDGDMLAAGGNLVLRGGSTVSLYSCTVENGRAIWGGGIAAIEGGSEIHLYGTTVDDNHARALWMPGAAHGGAVAVGASDKLYLHAGSHIGSLMANTAEGDGGAVSLEATSSQLHMDPGTSIQNGVAGLWGVGSGGCVGGLGVVTMNDATIEGCSAPTDGGAVKATTVTMSGTSRIGDADADRDGGAVHAVTVILEDTARIHTSTAGRRGGCIHATDLYLDDASRVETCAAGSHGGAAQATTVALTGSSKISDGYSGGSGGLLFVRRYGSLDMTGTSSLVDGEAVGSGGLVDMATGTPLTMTANVELQGGTAGTNGGLIRHSGNIAVDLINTLREGAAGGSGGLLHFGSNSSVTIKGSAELRDGAAGTLGGIIHLAGGSVLEVDGQATLRDATAGTHGGLVSLAADSTAMIGSGWLPSSVTLSGGAAVGDGGAIYANGTSGAPVSVSMGWQTTVRASAATRGGGIYIRDGSLDLLDDTHIGEVGQGNTATLDGGGIYASASEIFAWGQPLTYQPGFDVPLLGVRIEGNEAASLGGGIALTDGSTFTGNRLVVASNEASGAAGSGGGFAATSDSEINLQYAVIQDNHARRGGGLYLDGSALNFEGTSYLEGCSSFGLPLNRYCAEITGNSSKTAGSVPNWGGAIYSADSDVKLWEVAVQENAAGANGTSLYIDGGTAANLRNTLVVGTNDATPWSVHVASGASLNASMSTFSGVGSTLLYAAGASGTLHGNIIWTDLPGWALQAGAGVTGTCNVGGGVSVLGAGNFPGNPNFVTTPRGDWRVDPTSIAYDRCNNGPTWDLDGVGRPEGVRREAGAFEYYPW